MLYRQLSSGERRQVPPPAERKAIVQRLHERCGHFGRKRTTHLVLLAYWWAGLYKDVRSVIRCCAACDQVQATFNHSRPELTPLPMMGAFYRWHLKERKKERKKPGPGWQTDRQRGLQGVPRTGGGGKQGKQRHRREPQEDRKRG